MSATVQDHAPVTMGPFRGLYDGGDPKNTPLDFFQACGNVQFEGDDVITRDGLGISQVVVVPLNNVKRYYNYPTQTANTSLVLTYDGTTGRIYHVVSDVQVYGPILSIAGMTDFAFVPYAGRAYLSPFISRQTGDINIQTGMQSQFLYVYMGNGTAARQAAGSTPAGTLTIANGAAGFTDAGLHIFGVVGETDSGYLSPPIALNTFTTGAGLSVSFSTVPVFVGAQWIKRHIVASIKIASYNGNINGYDLFFIPGATINDNVTTVLANQSFFDADLFDDASHLSDNFSSIPAGAALSIYHDRLCLSTTYNDISLVYVSEPGEPEAINQITGLIIAPLDGNPITNHQELRDTFYVFKRARTLGYVDNDDVPSTWPLTVVDNSLGTCVHGIATVLDSGAVSVDYFAVCTFAGIAYFNGKYVSPEITKNIINTWGVQDRNEYRVIQIVNCPPRKSFYVVLPDSRLLIGNYENGMGADGIRWTPIYFNQVVNCVGIVNIDEIIIGLDIPF